MQNLVLLAGLISFIGIHVLIILGLLLYHSTVAVTVIQKEEQKFEAKQYVERPQSKTKKT